MTEAEWLALRGISGSAEETVTALIQVLEKADILDRCKAAQVLARMGAVAKPAAPVLQSILQEENPSLRLVAAKALWRITQSPGQSLPILTQLVQNKENDFLLEDIGVNHAALRVLGEMGSDAEEAAPLIRALLTGRVWRDHVEAAGTLWRITGSAGEGLPILIEALKCRWEGLGGIRYCLSHPALEVLATMGPQAKPAALELIEALKDGGETAKLAARALAGIGPEAREAVPALVELLHHQRSDVRHAAAQALKVIDAEAAAQAGVR
jgi:HEAT repeat protein